MHRRILGAALGVMLLAVGAPTVSAYPAYHDSFEGTYDFSTPDICPFDVTVHATISARYSLFFNSTGDYLVKIVELDTQQDVFTANGKTLVGEPYRYVGFTVFDAEENVTSQHFMGGLERVMLPDGTMFWSAGRFSFLDHPGNVGFTITPDNGHSGNVEAFCDALS